MIKSGDTTRLIEPREWDFRLLCLESFVKEVCLEEHELKPCFPSRIGQTDLNRVNCPKGKLVLSLSVARRFISNPLRKHKVFSYKCFKAYKRGDDYLSWNEERLKCKI